MPPPSRWSSARCRTPTASTDRLRSRQRPRLPRRRARIEVGKGSALARSRAARCPELDRLDQVRRRAVRTSPPSSRTSLESIRRLTRQMEEPMLKRGALLAPFAVIVVAAACASESPPDEDDQGAPQTSSATEAVRGTGDMGSVPPGGGGARPPSAAFHPAAAALNRPSAAFRPAPVAFAPPSATFHPPQAAFDPASDGVAVEASGAVGRTGGGLQVGAGVGASGSWGAPSSTRA
jgi:hypothetical protein